MEFNKEYKGLSFKQCKSNWSVYIKDVFKEGLMSVVSIDNILLISTFKAEFNDVTQKLSKVFDLTDNRDVSWLLECKVTKNRTRGLIILTQDTYIESILC